VLNILVTFYVVEASAFKLKLSCSLRCAVWSSADALRNVGNIAADF